MDKKKVKNNSFLLIFMQADGLDKIFMILGLLGSIGDGCMTPVGLLLTSKVINNLGGGLRDDLDQFSRSINKNAIYFRYMACGNFFLCFLEGYCWTRMGERQASRMRQRYLKAVLWQDISSFEVKIASTSEVVNSVSNDSFIIQDVIGEKVPNFLMNVFGFSGSCLISFVIMWRLAIVALPFSLLLIISGMMYGHILMGLTRKLREEYDKAGSVVEQAISSIRTVYSFVGETKTMTDFTTALQSSVNLSMKQGLAKGIAIGSNGITFAIWAFMCWYGSRLVMNQNGEGGTVFAVGASIVYGGLSLGAGLSNMKYFSEARFAGERIMEVIKRVPEIGTENMEGEILQNVSGHVEFRNINFSYPSRPESLVFQNFNLRVPAGKTVALVGESGSGKSTVIALLERFYDPFNGEILLDGVSINKLQLKWLRSQMGLVSQESALFATSITENVLFGKETATFEEVISATKASNAHNIITSLPQGYDTQVGERGVQMSGGQKQRIAIARAIIKAPKILLLDEATSALDSESESIVQEALYNASLGRTTIVIAHRLSTIRNADIIVVIQNGKVMEIGSHNQLIQDEIGLYCTLVKLQQTETMTEEESNNIKLSCLSSHITTDYDNSSHVSSGTQTSARIVSRSSSKNSVSGRRVSLVDKKIEKDFSVPSFRRLLLLNLPEWRQACFGCTAATFFGAVQPMYAYKGSMISVYFLADHDQIKSKTRMYTLFFFGLAVFSFIINVAQHYNFGAMGEYLTKRIRERMLSKILTLEVGWFDQDENSSGAVCSRFAKDAIVVRSLVGDRMALLIQTFSGVTIAFTMGLVIAWTTVEAVANFRTVTAFSSQSRILKIDAKVSHEKKASGNHVKELFQTFFILVATGRMIADAGSMTSDLAKGADAVGSIFANVDFAYPARPDVIIFKEFSLCIEAGKSTALVGQSGSGKSTIISLIKRFYDPLKGMVKIDGRNLKSYNLRSLRKHISLVSQEPILFGCTIRENIAYGASNSVDEAEIINAARVANAHDFITGLKDGYDTWCGNRGLQLSGGQKQRIAIARAILKNPAILLLDEATSALDSQSEKVVQEALDSMMVGRTCLVVAHRLSTIQNCDMIVVIDKGVVVEKGSHSSKKGPIGHSSLMVKGPIGAYYRLISI
ncbi:Abc transporter b family member [Thalictrum thalictroides]|uniref:Abc transporter b family member n=1 Tax=Thalictrum thalictroides TaxID=46969 RepID=A0A7J6WRV9_THATH|nr:Abc transporter b family member [Thalictrum thalictroides]